MADPFAQLSDIGQKALSLPTEIMSVGTRRAGEDIGTLNAKVQELSAVLMPAGGLSLPPFPTLPGTQSQAPPETKSEAVRNVKTVRKTSYMKV